MPEESDIGDDAVALVRLTLPPLPTDTEREVQRRRGFGIWQATLHGLVSSPGVRLQEAATELQNNRQQELNAAKDAAAREEAYLTLQLRRRRALIAKQEDRLEELTEVPARLNEEYQGLEQLYSTRYDAAKRAYVDLKKASHEAYDRDLQTTATRAGEEVGAITAAHLRAAKDLGVLGNEAREVLALRRQALVDYFAAQKKQLQPIWETAVQRVKRASDVGIDPGVAAAVYGAGAAAAVVAGWFFSAFAPAAGFESHTYVSYLISQFVDLAQASYEGSTVGGTARGILIPLAVWSGVVFLALILVTGVAAIAQVGIDRYDPIVSQSTLREALAAEASAERRKLLRRLSRRPDGPLVRWLRALPMALAAGGILVALALIASRTPHSDAASISSIYDGLAAETIGVLAAVALAGLGTLYVTWVLEPRWESARKGEHAASRGLLPEKLRSALGDHAELVALFTLFVIAVVMMGVADPSSDDVMSVTARWAAATAFGTMATFAGLALAYGHRYRSLFATERALDRRLTHFDSRTLEILPPPSVDHDVLLEAQFENDVRKRLSGLLDTLESRARMSADGADLVPTPDAGVIRGVWVRVQRRAAYLSQLVGARGEGETRKALHGEAPSFFISGDDRAYAPACAFEAEEAYQRFSAITAEMVENQRRLRAVELQRSDEEAEIRKRIQAHGRAIRALARRRGRTRGQFAAYGPSLADRYAVLEACLYEGFEVGRSIYSANGARLYSIDQPVPPPPGERLAALSQNPDA